MPKLYTELEITADESLREQLMGILSQVGFEGFWEEENSLRCYINADRWTDEMFEEVRRFAKTIHSSSASPAPQLSVKTIEDRNWNEEWEKTIRPLHVTDRMVITPTWHEYAATKDELVLTIDPKMSFGTGYHETTRLVLMLMEKYVNRGMSILDIGTGTGVLAIAGIKLGGRSAIGVDNDEWSFENATENVKLNQVDEQVTILQGELASVPMQQFDLIVANIQRNVIEPLLPEMRSRLSTHGVLLLSGLLNVDDRPMREAITSSSLEIMEMISENEWIAFAASL